MYSRPPHRRCVRRDRPLRVGFLPLTDAAPLMVAERRGLFTKRGLVVELQREVGWATVREKIFHGELDAAHAPAPMLWSLHLGAGCMPCPSLTAIVLNLHGNAVTLSRTLWEAGVRDASGLRAAARERKGRQPLTFGVVFHYSTHHLHLLDWLRAAGLDLNTEVRIVVVPPAQLFRNLNAGTIDGYCAGEPWNTLAVCEGAGWCPAWSAAHQAGHVGKVLAVKQRFAEESAEEHLALVSALAEACAWCDEPQNREPLAHILAEAAYLNLPVRVIAPALSGRFDCGNGRVESIPDFHVFHRGEANVPTRAKAAELQAALVRAGLLEAPSAQLPARLFREDLYREAVSPPPMREIASALQNRQIA